MEQQLTSPDRTMMALLQAENQQMNAQIQDHNRISTSLAQQPPPHMAQQYQSIAAYPQQHLQHPQHHQQIQQHHQHQHSGNYGYAVAPMHSVPIQPAYHDHPLPPPDHVNAKSKPSAGPSVETELRDLLDRNALRSLDEVAVEVVANERTSSAEKCKQLFAMLW
jgi:regulatory factor X